MQIVSYKSIKTIQEKTKRKVALYLTIIESKFARTVTNSGGHGAPLMPSVDKAINKDSEPGKIMLNIGGLGKI